MVYITIAHYKTPSGNDIHKVGIEPNIFVTGDATKVEHERVVVDYTKEFTEVDTNDPYIKRALEYLLEGK